MNLLITIFLIHGLGGTTHSLKPLVYYLNYIGYQNVHLISYPARTAPLNISIKYVNNEMLKIIDKKHEIIVIGQSLGGVICHELHKHGWDIQQSITIGSPHHGSSLLTFAQSVVHDKIAKYLHRPVYDDLLVHIPTTPNHPHYTISTSFAPCIPFDGQVWIVETKVGSKHIHIPFNNHWTIFLDPRLFKTVEGLLIIEKYK